MVTAADVTNKRKKGRAKKRREKKSLANKTDQYPGNSVAQGVKVNELLDLARQSEQG
jgi:hypothetical protein